MNLDTAVIDDYSTHALMAMAAREGLLSARVQTDLVFENICRTPVDYRVEEQLLEQIVLTPTIAAVNIDDFLWDALEGELKDHGHLVNLPKPAAPAASVAEISLDVLAGLVRAAGSDIPVEEFGPRADRAIAALEEEEAFVRTTGRKAPNMMLKGFREALNVVGHNIPDEYSESEYAAQQERELAYAAAAPLAAAVLKYESAALAAAENGLLLKTPILHDIGRTQVKNPRYSRGVDSDALVLLRVVARDLGKTVVRGSISECLKLSREPATAALREQIDIWQYALAVGDEAGLRSVQREIQQATAALSRLSGVRALGDVTTWIAIPATAVETALGLPPVFGLGLSVVGTAALAQTVRVTRRFKWATFGSS